MAESRAELAFHVVDERKQSDAFPHPVALADGHLFEHAAVSEAVQRLPGRDPAAARQDRSRAGVEYRIGGERVDDRRGSRVAPGVPCRIAPAILETSDLAGKTG